MQLYEYQRMLVMKALSVLKQHRLVILSLEMRVGKTPISLTVAKEFGVKKVLFITKKKVIDEILATYAKLAYDYTLQVINYESVHKVTMKPDLVILDECHRLGAFPIPGKATKMLKGGLKDIPVIYLSGTLTPESYSQLFHILWVSANSPFKHATFYAWAKEFVTPGVLYLGQQQVIDYSNARIDLIAPIIQPYLITYTQEEAGFDVIGYDEVHHRLPVDARIPILLDHLIKHKIYITKDELEILADTPAKLMSKHHQLSGGTVITECKNYIVIDTSKAEYIRDNFSDIKCAVYYLFKSELTALQRILGDKLTQDVDEFNVTDKIFVSQVVSGREGINLSVADDLIFYNIPHSYVSWSQTIARVQSKNKTSRTRVHYLLPELGKFEIEPSILDTVRGKEIYTSAYYAMSFLKRK